MKHPLIHRLALSVALSLSAASLVALAAEPQETTDVEIIANGSSEKVSIADLAVGQTRQLYSEAGTLVTATRTAESLELDIAGDKTSIRMVEHGDLDDAEVAALIEAEGGDGAHRVVRIRHHDVAHGDGSADAHHGDGKRKIVVVSGKDGDGHELDADAMELMLKHHGEPGAKQVIVKRRITRPADAAAK